MQPRRRRSAACAGMSHRGALGMIRLTHCGGSLRRHVMSMVRRRATIRANYLRIVARRWKAPDINGAECPYIYLYRRVDRNAACKAAAGAHRGSRIRPAGGTAWGAWRGRHALVCVSPRVAQESRWRAPWQRAIGSAGERLVHTEEVTGSIPVSPTRSVTRTRKPRSSALPSPERSDQFWAGDRQGWALGHQLNPCVRPVRGCGCTPRPPRRSVAGSTRRQRPPLRGA